MLFFIYISKAIHHYFHFWEFSFITLQDNKILEKILKKHIKLLLTFERAKLEELLDGI